MAMITIVFHPNDDLTPENKRAIAEKCLHTSEYPVWTGFTLTFKTRRSIADVLRGFEMECFVPEEFNHFSYER